MKNHTTTVLVTGLLLLWSTLGCATVNKRESLLRQRLAESEALQHANANVRDVRFSSDEKKVLVLLDLPEGSPFTSEFVLQEDGFHRFKGLWGWHDSQKQAGSSVRLLIDLESE